MKCMNLLQLDFISILFIKYYVILFVSAIMHVAS